VAAISSTGRIVNAEKVFVSTVVFLTDDEERIQRYGVSEVSGLEAEKALRSYLNDRDERIISVRIREPTRSEAASLNLSSGQVKLLN
jgi:hypothetical protein